MLKKLTQYTKCFKAKLRVLYLFFVITGQEEFEEYPGTAWISSTWFTQGYLIKLPRQYGHH